MTEHIPAPLEQFESLAELAPDEVLTTAEVTDHPLPGGAGTLALLTLDNGAGPRRPATLGPRTLLSSAFSSFSPIANISSSSSSVSFAPGRRDGTTPSPSSLESDS